MLPSYVTLTPAYGRDYNSKAEVLAALVHGKDFKLEPQGCYISRDELLQDRGWKALNVRYRGQRQIAVVKRATIERLRLEHGKEAKG